MNSPSGYSNKSVHPVYLIIFAQSEPAFYCRAGLRWYPAPGNHGKTDGKTLPESACGNHGKTDRKALPESGPL
jgi:hypothetical protein